MTNKEFARTDNVFKLACELAKVEPTSRQASKYRNRRGRAYTKRLDAKALVKKQETF
jgi:hypothetical protein